MSRGNRNGAKLDTRDRQVHPSGARHRVEITLVVAISMVLIVIVGSHIGMSLPFLLSRLKLDSATTSALLVTSLADVSGVLIYFTIARQVLQMPG